MLSYIDRFSDLHIAVIGDVMLDCYLHGEVRRISPEAPVPVVRSVSQKWVPGGAANVAANLAVLGLKVSIVALVGKDEACERLTQALAEHGSVDVSHLVRLADRPTTKKLRIVGAQQQIVRVDEEDTSACGEAVEKLLIAAAIEAVKQADLVIFSDYGKGVLCANVMSAAIAAARNLKTPILVDPKQLDLSAYKGATILTPNRKELTDATQMPCESDMEAEMAARRAQQMSGADILLTRSEKGMSFFPIGGNAIHLATVAQDVFDVSGAGDTVIGVLGAALAAGVPMSDAMKMANHAAGIVVAKHGTAHVRREELLASLSAESISPLVNDGRLLTVEEAVALRWSWAKDKQTVGIANGCFDLLHPGHVSLIRQAAASCDRLIMALNSDASVRRLKGASRPIQNERARAQVMGSIKGVAAVVIFDEDTPFDLITALQPDIIVKGADYAEDKVVGADIVRARGGRVVLAELSPGHSTTRLVSAVEATKSSVEAR